MFALPVRRIEVGLRWFSRIPLPETCCALFYLLTDVFLLEAFVGRFPWKKRTLANENQAEMDGKLDGLQTKPLREDSVRLGTAMKS